MEKCIFQKQKKQGRLTDAGAFPKVVLIDTVSLCNLRCSMCVHKEMTRKKGVMPWKIFTKIIDEIADTDKSVRTWLVFFGEAMILKKTSPSIFDMIKYAKNKGLKDVVLNSNANMLDLEAANELIDSGLDAIYIGLDAFKAKTYRKIRVGGDYEKTVRNVLNLIDLKNRIKRTHPVIYIQFVEMDSNKGEKNDFINFWKEKGAIVKIRPKVSWAGSIDAPNLTMGDKDRWPCHWAMQTMSVTDSGKVVTCAVDLDAKFVAGDINNASLKDIWNGQLKKIRSFHNNKEFNKLPPFCRACKDWQSARADYY